MIQAFYRLLIELTNRRSTSLLLKKFAQSKISRMIVPSFARVYKLNEGEMVTPLREYKTLHDLFTRRLKPGSRPIDEQPNTVTSPVDAVIEDIGEIAENLTITVKGNVYSIEDMLGDKDKLDKYVNGKYMILYLSPSHYHRIHSPITGRVVGEWTLGEKSYPVNKLGLRYGKDTLSKNYRKITEVKHEFGYLSIVKVGAMFVNSIETIHEGEQLVKGEEIAYFTFGSTVILLFEESLFEPVDFILPRDVKVGESIGYIKQK
ncbi:phosphatidylserine decarboxylase [Cytobacillus sp. FJAT-54145]|uniref:Phosphatidylserine decarboxylase proenzyme n=1 Tax=Cytobacillus spartinae TaxID=3299023 RepID=A0ABW6KGF6_9BACI